MKIYVKKVKNVKGQVKEWLWIEFYDKNNQRQRKSLKLLNTPANMEKAEILKAKLLLKKEEAKFIEKKIPTLDEYKVISFKMNEFNRTLTTQKDYESSYNNHIKPYLGNKKIDEIKASDIKYFANSNIKCNFLKVS